MSGELDGAVAFVTGAAGGIGRGVVLALEARGVRTAGLDLEPVEGSTLPQVGDVADETTVEGAVRRAEGELGPIDYLVCAAGSTSEHPVAQLPLAEWRRVTDSSLVGTFLATRAVLPGMLARRRGRIVALSSGFARKGYRNGAHYAAAKGGVEALVKSVALEVADSGITANVVAPGPVETPMLDHLVGRSGWRAGVEASIPMGRIGVPADVVGPVLFFLERRAAYITGQVLHVNGGLLMP
jgi:NAD(P)-dependent dehydrogenase (short-subunit alcohol dehydrogenase family)